MRIVSIVQVVLTGLLAASSVSSYQAAGHRELDRRHVDALLAFAIPASCSPVIVADRSPEPYHSGKKSGGNSNAKREREPHHAGRKGSKVNARESEPDMR
ncbi:hypothetical protein F5Y18DRAFT_424021 [Xylariaceae sp. FL1019]|nr:hypothetical protein F5Y18DRAFT_424021 [Xylariaceae sp. FL1019]